MNTGVNNMAGTGENSTKSKNKISLSNSLTKYLHDTVLPRRREIQEVHRALIRRIIGPILRKISELDDRFQSECEGLLNETCESFVGVNHCQYYKVDIAVVLSNLLSPKCLEKSSQEPLLQGQQPAAFLDSAACDNPYISPLSGFGYVLADTEKLLLHDLLSIKQDEVSSAQHDDVSFSNRSFLSPGKVVKRFANLVEESVEILLEECIWEEEPTVYEISVKREGHLVRLHVILRGEEYTIELIPALELTGWWPKSLQNWGPECAARPNQWLDYARMSKVKNKFHVFPARPPPGHDAFRLWCTYFSLSEKVLAQTVIEDDVPEVSCRAPILLTMLSLCEENSEEFYPVTPRIITTAFLHQCTQYPLQDDWTPNKLGRAFVDLFLSLIDMLKSGMCNHYFLPSYNILDNSEDLKPVAHHLKAILNDIVENPNKTQFLHLNHKSKSRAGNTGSR
ncbi:putative nucleotidyltransferase MAB21L1 [Lytechinus pictus]|uniref:putative nucleotidyltransferase MAB21L1 n=1 Tax=Lytechinus pictus TaxID=7653 RepID=UPI0030B9B235